MTTHDMSSQRRRDFLRLAASALILGSLPLGSIAAEGRLKIGVIGSGRVGSALGTSWARAGHEVMFSSLDLEHDRKLAASVGANARAGTPREAAAFGEVLLISVPYGALPQIGKDLGDLLKGKAVIDTCNPFPNRDGEIASWARASCVPSTPSAPRAWPTPHSAAVRARACRWRAMTSRQSRWPRGWCAMPDSSRCWSAGWQWADT